MERNKDERAAQSSMTSEGAPVGADEVDLSTGDNLPSAADAELERKIKSAFHQASALHLTKLTVRARNGEVTLAGTVDDSADIERVVSIVERFDEVTEIISRIVLRRVPGKASRLGIDETSKASSQAIPMPRRKSRRRVQLPDA